MKTKLLKIVKNRFSWKWSSDALYVFDNKKNKAHQFSTSDEAVLFIASLTVSTTEYTTFFSTREKRTFYQIKQYIQKQHK